MAFKHDEKQRKNIEFCSTTVSCDQQISSKTNVNHLKFCRVELKKKIKEDDNRFLWLL